MRVTSLLCLAIATAQELGLILRSSNPEIDEKPVRLYDGQLSVDSGPIYQGFFDTHQHFLISKHLISRNYTGAGLGLTENKQLVVAPTPVDNFMARGGWLEYDLSAVFYAEKDDGGWKLYTSPGDTSMRATPVMLQLADIVYEDSDLDDGAVIKSELLSPIVVSTYPKSFNGTGPYSDKETSGFNDGLDDEAEDPPADNEHITQVDVFPIETDTGDEPLSEGLQDVGLEEHGNGNASAEPENGLEFDRSTHPIGYLSNSTASVGSLHPQAHATSQGHASRLHTSDLVSSIKAPTPTAATSVGDPVYYPGPVHTHSVPGIETPVSTVIISVTEPIYYPGPAYTRSVRTHYATATELYTVWAPVPTATHTVAVYV